MKYLMLIALFYLLPQGVWGQLLPVPAVYNPEEIHTGVAVLDSLLRRFSINIAPQRDSLAAAMAPYREFLANDERPVEHRIIGLVCLGKLYVHNGREDEAFEYFREAEELAQALSPDDPYAGLAAGAFGNYLSYYYEYDLAQDYLKAGLRTVHGFEQPMPDAERELLMRLIVIYHDFGQLDSAMVYHDRMVAAETRLDNPYRRANALNNSAFLLHRAGYYEQAIKQVEAALPIYDTTDQRGLFLYVNTLETRAHPYVQFGRMEEALRDLAYVYEVRKRLGNFGHAAQALNYRLIYLDAAERPEAANRLLKAELSYISGRSIGNMVAPLYRTAADMLERDGDFGAAMPFRNAYNAFVARNALPELDRYNRATYAPGTAPTDPLRQYLNLRSQSFRQQREIESLQQQALRDKLSRQRTHSIILTVVVLLIGAAAFLYYRYQRERERLRLATEQRKKHILTLENDKLSLEVASKNRDLHQIAADNRLRTSVKRQVTARIAEAMQRPKTEWHGQLMRLLKDLEVDLDDESTLSELQDKIEDINTDFEQRLRERIPGITAQEIRFCSLLRLGMNNREIARTLHKSETTIRSYRFRLRKKAGVEGKGALTELIVGL